MPTVAIFIDRLTDRHSQMGPALYVAGEGKRNGLGTPFSVSLADAREKAAIARRKIAQGLNPIDERKRDGGVPTFGEMADQVREALSTGFRNDKHKAQWKSTLRLMLHRYAISRWIPSLLMT